jgi:tRNA (guanosine-2'-O-)-methyltransferase
MAMVGDGIENPANAAAILDAAAIFGVDAHFRDTKNLGNSAEFASLARVPLPVAELPAIRDKYKNVIACDRLPGAADVYHYRPPATAAVVVGNERRGLSEAARAIADSAIFIPMQSRNVNCLNVAAAAAIVLYYLRPFHARSMAIHRQPELRRPEILLMGGANPFELGSTIRSAAAFGWGRLLLHDPAEIWFGRDRAQKTRGRAAARRYRNPIRVIPAPDPTGIGLHFDDVVLVTMSGVGDLLPRLRLDRGPSQLVVMLDESEACAGETAAKLGGNLRRAQLGLPEFPGCYHFRQAASIVLAEISRQAGRRPSAPPHRPARSPAPFYDHALELEICHTGEMIGWEELLEY